MVTGNKQVAAAVAFSLALFSHVLNHVVIRLQSALYEVENPRRVLKVDSAGMLTHIMLHDTTKDLHGDQPAGLRASKMEEIGGNGGNLRSQSFKKR